MTAEWWQKTVIDQMHPFSFSGRDDACYGDPQGITDRLDHVANLGVDAVWLSSVFISPRAIAAGPGWFACEIRGTAIVGGMPASASIAIFIVPVASAVVMKFGRVNGRQRQRAPAGSPEPPWVGQD